PLRGLWAAHSGGHGLRDSRDRRTCGRPPRSSGRGRPAHRPPLRPGPGCCPALPGPGRRTAPRPGSQRLRAIPPLHLGPLRQAGQAGPPAGWCCMSAGLKIALVQDALPFRGGAERMLEAVLEILPQASLYTLVYNAPAFHGTRIAARQIHTSFIDRLPRARRSHRAYLPLFPFAIEQFDLSDYDLILSFSYAVAHGVLARPG